MIKKKIPLLQLFSLALAESRGAWRRFVFFVVCIAIGVGAMMTVKSFSSLIGTAIQGESKGLLAADLEIKSRWEQNLDDIKFQKAALPPETQFQFIKELHAMALYSETNGGKASLLVELKSIPAQAQFYQCTEVLNQPHLTHSRICLLTTVLSSILHSCFVQI